MGRNSRDNSMTRYEEMVKISIRYNDYIKRQMFSISLSSITRKPMNAAARYVLSVRYALNELNKEDKDIIMNEFFHENKNVNWWAKYYSKSTYYRKRNYAIKTFMENFAG